MKSQRRFAPKSDRNESESVAGLAGISIYVIVRSKATKQSHFFSTPVFVRLIPNPLIHNPDLRGNLIIIGNSPNGNCL